VIVGVGLTYDLQSSEGYFYLILFLYYIY